MIGAPTDLAPTSWTRHVDMPGALLCQLVRSYPRPGLATFASGHLLHHPLHCSRSLVLGEGTSHSSTCLKLLCPLLSCPTRCVQQSCCAAAPPSSTGQACAASISHACSHARPCACATASRLPCTRAGTCALLHNTGSFPSSQLNTHLLRIMPVMQLVGGTRALAAALMCSPARRAPMARSCFVGVQMFTCPDY